MTAKNKERKMHRATAKRLLDRLIKDVQEYNEDMGHPYYVEAIHVFGSYVNSDKEMLSDLDIALAWEDNKEVWMDWYAENLDDIKKGLRVKQDPSLLDALLYSRRRAIIGFRHGSPYIQLTDYHVDREAVESQRHIRIDMDIDGCTWTSLGGKTDESQGRL